MTHDQFDVLTRLMRGDPQSAANRAARAVLVHGMRPADAMRTTGAKRSTVSDAVKRYGEAHADICSAYLPGETAGQ